MKGRKYNFRYCGEYNNSPYGWTCMEEYFNRNTNALEILKVRYAKGEINKEEYDKMKKDIS